MSCYFFLSGKLTFEEDQQNEVCSLSDEGFSAGQRAQTHRSFLQVLPFSSVDEAVLGFRWVRRIYYHYVYKVPADPMLPVDL